MCGVACEGALDGEVNVTTADYSTAPDSDTCGMLLVGCDCTLHLQVLDERTSAQVAENGSTLRLVVKGVDGNGVSLTVENALVVQALTTDHCAIEASVDVGRQDRIETRITSIHEFGKGLQVFCRSNLIDTSHFGKCPHSCGGRKHHCGQTQFL